MPMAPGTTKLLCWVDWSNPREPQIREWTFDKSHPENELENFPPPQSLTDCKAEIQEKAHEERLHWIAVMKRVREMKIGDFRE